MREQILNLLRAGGAPPSTAFTPGRRFVLYGAGNRGREAKELLEENGCRLLGFIDQNPAAADFAGLPCLAAQTAPPPDWLNAAALVTIFNAEVSFLPIIKLLEEKGFAEILTFYDLDSVFHECIGDFFWLTRRDFYREHESEIIEAFDLLRDDCSRRTFEAALGLGLSGDFASFESLGYEEQYFPRDIPGWWYAPSDGPLRLVDCGAFDGDSILQAMKYGSIESVAAFEPDEENFRALAGRFRKGALQAATVALWPCGVWSQTQQLRFCGGQGLGSTLSGQGEEVISCVALDDALPAFGPTMIKMDIEGAEPDALTGARQILQEHRPRLAVRVYHRPEHLWQIALQLHSWNLGYEFYLRSHLPHNFDLTLYAVSER